MAEEEKKGKRFSKGQRENAIKAANGRCEGCGVALPARSQENQGGPALEVHHIVPRSQGGTNESKNAAVLCGPRRCHAYANELALKYGILFTEVTERLGDRPFTSYHRRTVERAERRGAVRHALRRLRGA